MSESREDRVDRDVPEPLRRVGRFLPSYSDGLRQAGMPGTYAGGGKPQFGRPDGEQPLHEDDHVAHVETDHGMDKLQEFLASKGIRAAEPPRWRSYDPERPRPGNVRIDPPRDAERPGVHGWDHYDPEADHGGGDDLA